MIWMMMGVGLAAEKYFQDDDLIKIRRFFNL
jgi:hypothetical protein